MEHSEAQASAPARTRRSGWRIAGIVALVVGSLLLLGLAGFVIWASSAAQPMPEALAALQSDNAVTVSQENWIEFAPAGGSPTTGLIFYPGGRVDPRAYAPPARALAERGYLVAVTPVLLNLAIFDPDRASAVIAAHPEIDRWLIGGHSLGGTTAAMYANRHPDAVDGVVFWAAYPAGGDSLADRTDLTVTSIYGTLDGLATPAKIEASIPLLPADAQFVTIEGGNHAQFGWYGDQSGDNPATISREDQQAQVVAATAAALAGR